MSFVTYILYSDSLQKYHIDQTNDIDLSVQQHNAGRVKHTKNGVPWILIDSYEFESRARAKEQELKIKSRGVLKFLEDLEMKKK